MTPSPPTNIIRVMNDSNLGKLYKLLPSGHSSNDIHYNYNVGIVAP